MPFVHVCMFVCIYVCIYVYGFGFKSSGILINMTLSAAVINDSKCSFQFNITTTFHVSQLYVHTYVCIIYTYYIIYYTYVRTYVQCFESYMIIICKRLKYLKFY